MNNMKRQNHVTMNNELPGPVGARYATGKEWRNISRKNEEAEPKQDKAQLWMWLVMEVKSDVIKNSIS